MDVYKGSAIYSIECVKNHKIYWGSTKNTAKRYKEHWSLLNNGKHPNAIMQRTWNKYGSTSFVFSIVDKCLPSQLLLKEQARLDLHWGTNYCMNLAKNAEAPARDIKRGPQTKEHIRQRVIQIHKKVKVTNLLSKKSFVFDSRKSAAQHFNSPISAICYRISTGHASKHKHSRLAGWLFENQE